MYIYTWIVDFYAAGVAIFRHAFCCVSALPES
jgi:hypothetical protein